MDYGDISTKFEQGICKLQKLYSLMTVMGIALLVLSWFADLIEEDIVPFFTFMRIPTICTFVYGVLLIILATLGTYGLRTKNTSFYKGVYYGCFTFMFMCFIGCILALTCYFADYKTNLARFRRAVGAYEYNKKTTQIADELSTKGVANDRRYPDEIIIKEEKELHQICLLLSLCLLLFAFIMAALCISMRSTVLEMLECNDILLRAVRSFDPSNMLLSANHQPSRALTPRISRRNSTRGADFNTLVSGIMLENEKELYGKLYMATLSTKRKRENAESSSVKDEEIRKPKKIKDEEIGKPKKENSLQNGQCVIREILI